MAITLELAWTMWWLAPAAAVGHARPLGLPAAALECGWADSPKAI